MFTLFWMLDGIRVRYYFFLDFCIDLYIILHRHARILTPQDSFYRYTVLLKKL
jgi:hypothetical protein